MKTISFLKRHFLVAIALLTAGVTVSFKMAETKAETEIVYHFIGTDMDAGSFRNVDNWSTINNSIDCVSEVAELPCKITLADNVSLATVLGSKSNAEVLAISEGYKPEP